MYAAMPTPVADIVSSVLPDPLSLPVPSSDSPTEPKQKEEGDFESLSDLRSVTALPPSDLQTAPRPSSPSPTLNIAAAWALLDCIERTEEAERCRSGNVVVNDSSSGHGSEGATRCPSVSSSL